MDVCQVLLMPINEKIKRTPSNDFFVLSARDRGRYSQTKCKERTVLRHLDCLSNFLTMFYQVCRII